MEAASPNRVRIGLFEFDLTAGELCDGDGKVRRLQEQPFQILLMLVEHSGRLVRREEIQKKLWPNGTVVEFDHSIHTAINKLRQAFGDSAEDPKYIETVARRGYRLMVSVERLDPTPASSPTAAVAPPVQEASVSSLSGKRVSHYHVLEVLGGGGMGVVYKAEDLKLGRRVALKFLPEEIASDAKALERFEREARAASALDHPNICTIHEFGEHDGRPFIVMALLEGQTLRDRIAVTPGPFRLPELLKLAIQIADGLAAAHEKGIIHRDIKPANIFVTDRDEVKILDFGLAKLTDASDHERSLHAEAETASVRDLSLSLTGVAMGTVPYMSPEQLRGEKLDARTDLFSLGLVIYEMATGKRAFREDTAAHLQEAILNRAPVPARELNPALPHSLVEIINKTMEKDRDVRCQSAAELRADLKRLKWDTESNRVSAGGVAVSPVGWKRNLWLGVVALLVVLAGITWGVYHFLAPKSVPFQKTETTQLTASGKVTSAAISPDGKYVAYTVKEGVKSSLWVQQVRTGSDVQLAPPADGRYVGLTFSRDGDFLYFVRSEGEDTEFRSLYKIPALGGRQQRLISDVDSRATLSPDGKRLAFVRNSSAKDESALILANEDGSGERQVAVRKYPNTFQSVSWSPDGGTIATGAFKEEAGLSYASPVEVPAEGGAEHSFTPKRWACVCDLAWLPDGQGLAVNAQEQTGGPVQIGYISYPSGEFRSITSDLNTYVGVSLTADHSSLATVQSQLYVDAWVAPIAEPDSAKPSTSGGQAWWSTWSPDQRIVFLKYTGNGANIWMMDPDGRNVRQLTADIASQKFAPRVSPDGRYIAFVSDRTGSLHIWRTDIDGSNPKQLTSSPQEGWDSRPAFSADGKWVVYTKSGEEKGIWKVNIEGGDPVRLNDAYARNPAVSPDGRWIAYSYRDTKARLTPNSGVAIMAFDGGPPEKRFDIPSEWFRWTADGSSLFYVKNKDGVDNIWNQPIAGRTPQQITHFNNDLIFGFDVCRDGKSFVIERGRLTSDVVLIRDLR